MNSFMIDCLLRQDLLSQRGQVHLHDEMVCLAELLAGALAFSPRALAGFFCDVPSSGMCPIVSSGLLPMVMRTTGDHSSIPLVMLTI